jgi:hypothetical protein
VFLIPKPVRAMHVQYVLADTVIEVRWDAPAAGAAVHDVFQHLGLRLPQSQQHIPAVVVVCSTASSSPSVPPGAEQVLTFGNGMTGHRAGTHLLLKWGNAVVRLDSNVGAGRISVPPGVLDEPQTVRRLLFDLLTTGLLALLRPRQLYSLHATALTRNETGVLLADGGDGNHAALSYSLAQQGWSFLSDSVLLHPEAEADIDAVAFRTRLAMNAEARDTFPEIAPFWEPLFGNAATGTVAMHRLSSSRSRERCTPTVLVVPEIADRPDSRLLPMRKVDALHHVLKRSALLTLSPDRAPHHVETARRLVDQARSYQLVTGRDLRGNPPAVARLLEDALPHSPPAASTSA